MSRRPISRQASRRNASSRSCARRSGRGPLPLTSGIYVRFREIRRHDLYGVFDLFGVPVLALEGCPAGGPGGPVPVGGLGADLVAEQGDGGVSAGGGLV